MVVRGDEVWACGVLCGGFVLVMGGGKSWESMTEYGSEVKWHETHNIYTLHMHIKLNIKRKR